MSQRFVRKITVLDNGQVEVERQIPALNHVSDPPEIGQGTRVHVLAVFQGLVFGFYAGDKAQREFVGQAIQRKFTRETTEAEDIIAFRGKGDLQFFANLSVSDPGTEENAMGEDIYLAACCGLIAIEDLCVDKEQNRLFVGGTTISGSNPVIVEVDPATALPKKLYPVGNRARSVDWSAARDGAIAVILDNGAVKVLQPEGEKFLDLPPGKEFLAKKVFSGKEGFYFREVGGDISYLTVDRDGVDLGTSTQILNPGEDLLCVVQGLDGKDLLVITSDEGYTFAAAPA